MEATGSFNTGDWCSLCHDLKDDPRPGVGNRLCVVKAGPATHEFWKIFHSSSPSVGQAVSEAGKEWKQRETKQSGCGCQHTWLADGLHVFGEAKWLALPDLENLMACLLVGGLQVPLLFLDLKYWPVWKERTVMLWLCNKHWTMLRQLRYPQTVRDAARKEHLGWCRQEIYVRWSAIS